MLPQRGSVIRYAYLWAHESQRGRVEGRKDRPTLVLSISVVGRDGTHRVYVAAITHTPPSGKSDAVRFPDTLKRKMGLDPEPAWIVTTELNTFIWPGPDIRPIPSRRSGTPIYGVVPDELVARVVESFLANRDKQQATVVNRTV